MAITQKELNAKLLEFDYYMSSRRWDEIDHEYGEGIYQSDGLRSISAFIEFCCTGRVTDNYGNELEG